VAAVEQGEVEPRVLAEPVIEQVGLIPGKRPGGTIASLEGRRVHGRAVSSKFRGHQPRFEGEGLNRTD